MKNIFLKSRRGISRVGIISPISQGQYYYMKNINAIQFFRSEFNNFFTFYLLFLKQNICTGKSV